MGLLITASSSYEWFSDELKDEAVFKEIPKEHRKSIFEALQAKAKEVAKAREAEEDAEKVRMEFKGIEL